MFILEWTNSLDTSSIGLYTGMDKTSLHSSSRTLFVREGGREGGREGEREGGREGGCPRHVERRVT